MDQSYNERFVHANVYYTSSYTCDEWKQVPHHYNKFMRSINYQQWTCYFNGESNTCCNGRAITNKDLYQRYTCTIERLTCWW